MRLHSLRSTTGGAVAALIALVALPACRPHSPPGPRVGPNTNPFVQPAPPPEPLTGPLKLPAVPEAAAVLMDELRRQHRSLTRFAEKHAAPEEWAMVDGRWAELLDSPAWEAEQLHGVPAAVHLRNQVAARRRLGRDRFEVAANDAIRTALNKAAGYAARDRYQDARKQLQSVPKVFHGLPQYDEVKEKLAMAPPIRWTPGAWVEVTPAQFRVAASQSAQQTTDDVDGATVFTGDPKGMLVVFTPEHSQSWKNYVIEMEAYAETGETARSTAQLGMRVSRGARLQGKGFTFGKDYAGRWLWVRAEVKGEKLIVTVDGEEVIHTSTGEHAIGKPMLLVNTGATLKVRTVRYQVN